MIVPKSFFSGSVSPAVFRPAEDSLVQIADPLDRRPRHARLGLRQVSEQTREQIRS
jgi:hypothetical protein